MMAMSCRNGWIYLPVVCWIWGSHSGDCEKYCLLGCDTAVTFQNADLFIYNLSKDATSNSASTSNWAKLFYLTFVIILINSR
jgi:hypothetical protein